MGLFLTMILVDGYLRIFLSMDSIMIIYTKQLKVSFCILLEKVIHMSWKCPDIHANGFGILEYSVIHMGQYSVIHMGPFLKI